MKAGIAVVVGAAALALGGCGGSDGGSEKQSTAGPTSATASTPAPAAASTSPARDATATATSAPGTDTATATGTGATAGAGGDASQSVEGVWLATETDSMVQLVLTKGTANLTSTHLCGGAYTGKKGVDLTLTCMDGNKERTKGHGVLAQDGATLTVQWSGGPTDVFSRTGLPSD